MAQLCLTITTYFIGVHFKRFKPVADAVIERCREEFDAIHASTTAEMRQMLEIEKSYHYLSKGSENEYMFIYRLLNENSDLNSCPEEKLKTLMLDADKDFYQGDSKVETQIRTIKNSVHAYWQQLVSRFIA